MCYPLYTLLLPTVHPAAPTVYSAAPDAGIGEEAVNAIVGVYPTPISLYRAYAAALKDALACGRNAPAAARALLADVAQGSGQRLGPSKAAAVYDKLFANGWNLAGQQQQQ
jgi:hypothetical protein